LSAFVVAFECGCATLLHIRVLMSVLYAAHLRLHHDRGSEFTSCLPPDGCSFVPFGQLKCDFNYVSVSYGVRDDSGAPRYGLVADCLNMSALALRPCPQWSVAHHNSFVRDLSNFTHSLYILMRIHTDAHAMQSNVQSCAFNIELI
jgi:hypothetical protein